MKKTILSLLFSLCCITGFCAVGYEWVGSAEIGQIKYSFFYGNYTDGDVFQAKVVSTEGVDFPNGIVEIPATFTAKVTLSSKNGFFAENRTVEAEWTVISILNNAFMGRSALKSITIPGTVSSIGSFAFDGCDGLMEVRSLIEEPFAISNNTFSKYDFTLYVPKGTKSKYQVMAGWKQFGDNIVEMDEEPSGGTESDIITFADANVKGICVENWDGDGDGELSKAEAEAVTDLGTVFNSKSNITSFDELQYFTGLTTISENAFQYCRNLTSIILPESLISIGRYAFLSCEKLATARIPNSVTEIGYGAFIWCYELNPVIIPSSVTSIGHYAFRGCRSLQSLTIPSTVTEIGYGITSYCDNLGSIVVESGNPNYDSRDNCNAIISKSSNNLIAGGKNTIIPSSGTSIGYNAFAGNGGLESITIPAGVKNIIDEAFAGCYALTSVNVESGNTVYDSRDNCNAIIETEKNELVAGCKNTVIPNTVTSIRKQAFYQCKHLESITIPGSVKTIGTNCFDGCVELAKINFSDGLETVGGASFQNCDALTSVAFPNSLKTIEPWAFNSCHGLLFITIPSSVTTIGEKAFYQIPYIKEVRSDIKEPFAITDDVFQTSYSSGKFTSATLYVPVGTKSKYEATDGWKNFTKIVEGTPVEPTPDIVRNVVMEEATGTWCGWCIRGFVAMKQAREEFGDRFIGIAVHTGDVMSLGSYYNLNINGYPSCNIDRDGEIYDPSDLYIVRGRMSIAPTVGVSVKGEWNADKTTVTATSETQFLVDGDGYSVAYVLVADGLTGTSSRWYQNNAYSGMSSGDPDLQAYCEMASPITDMVYDDVMVGSSYSSGLNQAESFGGAMKKGDMKSNSYTLSLPTTGELAEAIDKNRVYVVAIVTNPDGTIANAAKTKVGGKDGDVNGDNVVDVADISSVISVMAGEDASSFSADVNGDGVVDVADIATVISIMAGGGSGN